MQLLWATSKSTYEDHRKPAAVPALYEHGVETIAPPGHRAARECAGPLPFSLRGLWQSLPSVCLCGTGSMALSHGGLFLPATPHTGSQLCCPRLAGFAHRPIGAMRGSPSAPFASLSFA